MGRPQLERCPHFRNPKHTYEKGNVARFDAAILRSRYPEYEYEVFRCRHCKKWHIGRKTKETPTDE